jgi:hypothetical protein
MRIDLSELPGRQVRALGSPARLPVAWVTSQDVLGALAMGQAESGTPWPPGCSRS